jgi:hypothetical protein
VNRENNWNDSAMRDFLQAIAFDDLLDMRRAQREDAGCIVRTATDTTCDRSGHRT